jgi:hypothetical protein
MKYFVLNLLRAKKENDQNLILYVNLVPEPPAHAMLFEVTFLPFNNKSYGWDLQAL